MKTKEELLKIYSSYLPYELEFINNDIPRLDNAWTMVGLKLDHLFSDTILSKRNDYENTINISIKTAKPILYPMDYLTREIEYKGERFIPQNKMSHLDLEWLITSDDLILKTNYEDVSQLLEWNFNVFELSDSEYIKK